MMIVFVLKGIAGPNIDILAPRGSAKSTVLGLYTAWAIGIHALNKMPLKILYISYTVDVARPKSAAVPRADYLPRRADLP